MIGRWYTSILSRKVLYAILMVECFTCSLASCLIKNNIFSAFSMMFEVLTSKFSFLLSTVLRYLYSST